MLVVDPVDRAALTAAVELQTRLPGVRVICVSDSVNLSPEAKALNPDALVAKPFGLTELERALRKVLWK